MPSSKDQNSKTDRHTVAQHAPREDDAFRPRLMIHARKRLALYQEIRLGHAAAQLSADQLERDLALQWFELFGQIHPGHATLAKQAFDAVGTKMQSRWQGLCRISTCSLDIQNGRLIRRADAGFER